MIILGRYLKKDDQFIKLGRYLEKEPSLRLLKDKIIKNKKMFLPVFEEGFKNPIDVFRRDAHLAMLQVLIQIFMIISINQIKHHKKENIYYIIVNHIKSVNCVYKMIHSFDDLLN